MRWIIGVAAAAAILYSGYWFVGSQGTQTAMQSWLDERASKGWIAESSEVKTRGFPSRFDTTISDLNLADPATGWAWSAPFFQIFSLSYSPNHVIAIWPNEQQLSTPFTRLNVTSEDMRGSIRFEPDTNLTLDRATFEMMGASFASSSAGTTKIGKASASVRQTPAAVLSQDVFADLKEVTLPDQLRALLDPAGLLPEQIEGITIDATAEFDAPWDRFAIETARPQPTNINLKLAAASWGELDLRAAGEVAVDANGIPTGKITIKAKNWRQMLGVAENSGLLPADVLPMVTRGLEVLAGLSGNAKTLDVPLTFRNGRMAIGPLPIGPAPRIQLR